ncbi:MAG: threonylcarbamoyl-AMP synthase [Chlorobium sp.]|jgi:L-threonylcarbamoyladenylate synthase|uniref:L-threonylcarbamoyladenylate synthase n=1 Tax=Chlorobium sp. TaxID=1095 RepID=UPI001DF7F71D|nr:L-threonylcarbamoyladenylate synthase [Chlorobium sp.]MBN1279430.1 threonylcarbamoyl-AMP synthase [Chlorobiaceae bacterium]MCF8216461.1 threonylcarbamoyl-AMP synthase [Chlorobium sp.]MCF8271373.1 threonylcarbamoyl-AMP synthase [Chlorobium sp.]MCF8287738.1 threonylcarbamoyl-AMP synthase [Chlorobium sp.]MCF8291284.1 threonylcarbamoyl-AMP synthase [Chlorobium sp.]
MQTIVTDSAKEAASYINSGKIVAFPTETVYGLGVGICYPDAIENIFIAKGRPRDNPLIVHIARPADIDSVGREIGSDARKLVKHFFPGPLTLVLKKSHTIPGVVTAGLDTVGVRCPSNPIARNFLELCLCPVAAPSANTSGRPSSTSWEAVLHDLKGKIDCILKGAPSDIGLESTIVDCSNTPPILLRNGAVTIEELLGVIPEIRIGENRHNDEPPKSPGLKYPHYAPLARILLCTSGETVIPESETPYAWIGLTQPPVAAGFALVRQCGTTVEYARVLFDFFRKCDTRGIGTIYCELPPAKGIGRAILDRITRAAESN